MSKLSERLLRYKDNSGVMASLRCLLVPAKEHKGWHVLSRLGIHIKDKDSALIAGLFAFHPVFTPEENYDFGATCRRIHYKQSFDESDKISPFEKRFERLLAAEKQELGDRLRGIITFAKKENIPVNYDKLRDDIRYWGVDKKKDWASSFWNFDTDINLSKDS